MNHFTDRAIQRVTARWIDREIEPNVYAVATLKQKIGGYGSSFNGSWIKGDKDRYEAEYQRFIRRLSKAIYGKTAYRRYNRLLPHAASLEGGNDVRYHLNILVRRPDWLEFDRFRDLLHDIWLKNPWAMPDVKIEERIGDCVSYSLKEGMDTLIV